MIQSVTLKNFQSHKNTKLEFHPGMNVIVGASDSGKTAVIRALRWVITNRPGGEAFRSNWGGDTEVVIETETGQKVLRKKTNVDNCYQLDDLLFKAFGQDVPDEILKALNIDNINIQQQLDAPFLLSETAGGVALHFNRVARLDKIDKGLNNVQKELNTINKNIEHETKEVNEKEQLLENFIDLDGLQTDIERVEGLVEAFGQASRSIHQLENIETKHERISEQLEKSKHLLIMGEAVDEALEKIKEKKQVEKEYNEVRKLSLKIHYNKKEVDELNKICEAEGEVNDLLNLYEKRKNALISWTKLVKLYKDTEEGVKTQENQLKSISQLELAFKKNFPDVCPLCNHER